MGWRDRDYARMTNAERRRFYGVQTQTRRGSARSPLSLLVLLAIAVLGLVVLPHFNIHGHHYRVFFF